METFSIEYLWIIDSGFAYGGVIIQNGKVVEAAPIFRKTLLGNKAGTAKWKIQRFGWQLVKIIRRRM